MASIVSIARPLACSDGCQLLGDVDPDRAPGDAPTAADAAGAPELVEPRPELVGEPLAVARVPRGADAAAVDVRVVDRVARVPFAGPLGVPGQVGVVLDAGAEARRAHERAVAAGEAPRCDLVPAVVLEIAGEHVADVGRVDVPAHALDGSLDGGARGGEIARRGRPR